MSNFSKNYNIPRLPVGAVEWPAIVNTLVDRVEAGRTIKVTAGEALAANEAVQPPDSTGKVFKATNLTNFLGIVKDAIALNAEGFVYASVGNEVTDATWAWTVGGLIYVGATAGTLTQIKPTPDAIPIGYATATSIVLGRPVINERPQAVSHHFAQPNVAAGQTAVAIPVLGLATNTEIVLPRKGSVTGISIASNEARTGGSLTVDVLINGAATGLQAILDATNTQYHFATQVGEVDTFVAGDRLGVAITTDAGWLPTTADVVICMLVEV